MKYKIVVEGPALTRSGYGEHTRLVLRALRAREDVLDIYLHPLNWGTTSWFLEDEEETQEIMFINENGKILFNMGNGIS